jgi:ketosteroid isomerase-like protein
MSDAASQLLDLEQRRCAAISAGDIATLKAMLTDDYVHVHMTGRVDDRDGHLKAVADRPRWTERGELLVRVYGDLAILTGELTNLVVAPNGQVNATRAYCHQVAVRQNGAWRFISTQLRPLRARQE